MNADKIFQKIAQACDGLIYISESDAPVNAFLSNEQTEEMQEKILSQIAGKENATVEEVNFASFFERLTGEKDWHGEKEKARAEKFRVLKRVLEDNLSELRVFKFGRVRKEIFIIGLDKDGRLMGAKTEAVET